MTSNKIQVNQELIDALQYATGTDLDCEELMALANDKDPSIKIVFGCVQALNYAPHHYDQGDVPPQLQKVVLRDVEGHTKSIRKTSSNQDDCIASNLNEFGTILKNAADFGHEVFAITRGQHLVSVTLGINKCNTKNVAQAAFITKPGGNPRPF